MQNSETQAPTVSVEDESAKLYKAENEARENLDLSLDTLVDATFDEFSNEQAFELAAEHQEIELAAIKNSNEFATEHLDELHEAALKEAAQRVANVYADAERSEDT